VRQRTIATSVENHVVAALTVSELVTGVVDDMICADRSDHLHFLSAADAGHLCSVRFRNLHGEGSHASGRTGDQDPVTRLYPSRVSESLQGGEGGDREAGGG